MPRYKGISMPKLKKKAVVQPSEAQDEFSDPPGPPESPAPPSHDSMQVSRKRPAQSPGMSAVKQAAYSAKKALRASRKAHAGYLRVKIKQFKRYPLIVARQHIASTAFFGHGRRQAMRRPSRTSRGMTRQSWRRLYWTFRY